MHALQFPSNLHFSLDFHPPLCNYSAMDSPFDDILTDFSPPATAASSHPNLLWPPRLSFDVASGVCTEQQLLDLHDLSQEQLDYFYSHPLFRREVAEHKRYINENGITFKAKARLQAEEYLLELHNLISSPDTPASVRLAAIQSVVRWGGLEPPKETKSDGNSSSSQTKIEIAWITPETTLSASNQLAARVTTTSTQTSL